jgi:histidinol-phosphate aminotransferase
MTGNVDPDGADLVRADLEAIPRYVPGRNPADLARELGLPDAIKLASNEVPYGPLPGVAKAVSESLGIIHRYPDLAAVGLRDALAQRHGLDPDRIATGCGSVALAEHVVRAAALPGDEVLYSWRSFEAYPILTTATGATSVQVPNTPDHAHDLDAMAAAVTERTKVAFICTPNNPTGTVVHADALGRFLDAVGPEVLVVIDEAYHEFVRDPEVPNGLVLAASRPNVVVLRTFSKAWGMAGLRVGWLVAAPAVANAVRKVTIPFSTNALGQVAALAALEEGDEVRRRVGLIVDERSRVRDALLPLRPDVPVSEANFVWLPLGEDSAAFAAGCEKRGVIVRPFADGVRVTIGTPAENDAFLTAAADLLTP